MYEQKPINKNVALVVLLIWTILYPVMDAACGFITDYTRILIEGLPPYDPVVKAVAGLVSMLIYGGGIGLLLAMIRKK